VAPGDPEDFDTRMQHLAERAVREARARFSSELDYSLASVQVLERILAQLCRTHRASPLDPAALADQADLWGAYLGEVLRRLRTAAWVLGSRTEGPGVATLLFSGGEELYPPAWCHRRIRNDPDQAEDDVWSKLQALHRRGFFAPPELRAPRPARRGLDGRFLPAVFLVAGAVLAGLHVPPAGSARAVPLLALGILCALVGAASLADPSVLWAVGPHRYRLTRQARRHGLLVWVGALVASAGLTAWLAL